MRYPMKSARKTLALLLLVFSAPIPQSLAEPILEVYGPRTGVLGQFQTTGLYDPVERYSVGAQTQLGEAFLSPEHPVNLPRGGTPSFLNILQTDFPRTSGWSFTSAPNDLTNGSLRVGSYDVVGNANRVGIEGPGRIGFDVQYVPTTMQAEPGGPKVGDPTENVHWIQTVTNNHNITTNPGHGNPTNIVDTVSQTPAAGGHVGRAPYYDDRDPVTMLRFPADSRNFLDLPFRLDGNDSHTWFGQLYLVTGPDATSPGLVTIYNGIGWGWRNVAPEPSTAVLLASGLVGLACRLRRRS